MVTSPVLISLLKHFFPSEKSSTHILSFRLWKSQQNSAFVPYAILIIMNHFTHFV